MDRVLLLEKIVEFLTNKNLSHPLRVAIDGIDASGKTTLAKELEYHLIRRNCTVIRASVDGFHNPSEIRYKRGKNSPEGYYYDSFDYEAIIADILEPLGVDGDLKYKTTKFNFLTNSEVQSEILQAQPNSVLLFDGVFLLRPELFSYWDTTIFIDIDFEESVKRALVRDQKLFGQPDNVKERYSNRYIPGQKIYLTSVNPIVKADIIIENNDPDNASIKFKTPI